MSDLVILLVACNSTTEYSRPRRFRRKLEEWLRVISAIWPECPAQINADGRSLKIHQATPVRPIP